MKMRRYRALRSVGVDPISAAFIAALNYLFLGPAVGRLCIVGFMHVAIEIDDNGGALA